MDASKNQGRTDTGPMGEAHGAQGQVRRRSVFGMNSPLAEGASQLGRKG